MADIPLDVFLVPGPPWVLVLSSAVLPNGGFQVANVLRMQFDRADGSSGQFVPIFTDEDLAIRFKESLGEFGQKYHQIRPSKLDSFIQLLERLERYGIAHIGIDPGHGQLFHPGIADVIEAAKKWRI